MKKDWIKIAELLGVPAPANPELFLKSLNALEATFRPLVSSLPFETDPAVILSESAVEGASPGE